MIQPLVSTDWLKSNLHNPNLIVLGVSLKPIPSPFEGQFIPRTRFVPLKEIFVDKTAEFPNAFPTELQFRNATRKLGIHRNSQVVIYDWNGMYSSPRLWFIFRAMGFLKVSVLDGGFVAWKEDGGDISHKNEVNITEGDYVPRMNKEVIKKYKSIKLNCSEPNFTLIDARSSGRFQGIVAEPRASLKSGSIPNSYNLPFKEVMNNGRFKSKEELSILFSSYDREKPLVFSCGSGITACIILLAATIADFHNVSLYDGSWTEWATKEGLLH